MADDDRPRFEPPPPPETSALETAGHVAAVVGIAALDLATGGILDAMSSLPGVVGPSYGPPPDLSDTAPPTRVAGDRVACTRCGTAVPYESMSLDEHGYFCAGCVAVLREG
jgi:hypothetical protein